MFKLEKDHIIESSKIAEGIFSKPPVEQQEMLQNIKFRLQELNKIHLEKIKLS